MKWIAIAVLLCLTASDSLAALDPMETVSGTLAERDNEVGRGVRMLGQRGVLMIRTAGRYDQILKKFESLGWSRPANGFPAVDFSEQAVVCVYANLGNADSMAVHQVKSDGKQVDVDFLLSHVIRERSRALEVGQIKFAMVPVTGADAIAVRVLTSATVEGQVIKRLPAMKPEWGRVFTATSGDVVNGLTAAIAPKAVQVKAGGDILLQFRLEADGSDLAPGVFASPLTEVPRVWDGKYSNGYRNHGFLVTLPDGVTVELRPKEILNWDKNAPHLVEITPEQPYVLPGWAEGDTFKSLKEMGLDTSLPGKYVFIGMYAQGGTAGEQAKSPVWIGELATSPVTVEVTSGN